MPHIHGLYYSHDKMPAAGPDDWREMSVGDHEPSADTRRLIEQHWARRSHDSGIYWLHASLHHAGHDVPIGQVAHVLLAVEEGR